MSDLVVNPEDGFSLDTAHIILNPHFLYILNRRNKVKKLAFHSECWNPLTVPFSIYEACSETIETIAILSKQINSI